MNEYSLVSKQVEWPLGDELLPFMTRSKRPISACQKVTNGRKEAIV